MFRAQREAADAVYERLQEISGLLAQVRKEVELVASNADLRVVLQREQTWLSQAERTVSELRAWREREARQFLAERCPSLGARARLRARFGGGGGCRLRVRCEAVRG